jgi:hypothetical protein
MMWERYQSGETPKAGSDGSKPIRIA